MGWQHQKLQILNYGEEASNGLNDGVIAGITVDVIVILVLLHFVQHIYSKEKQERKPLSSPRDDKEIA
eukprot:3383358-Ditylum_brightwellii.AAC.1